MKVVLFVFLQASGLETKQRMTQKERVSGESNRINRGHYARRSFLTMFLGSN